LITAVTNAVVLDKDFDITSFAQQLQGISAGDLHFVTIPIANITLHTPHDGDAVEVDPHQVQAFIQQQINDPNGTSTTSPSSVANSHVTVDVYNANGTTGLAGEVLNTLAAQGFTPGQAITATNQTTTLINYGAGEETAARSMASTLGGGIRLVADSTLTAGHVRVYLGKDYAGPNTQRITAPAALHLDDPPAQEPPAPTNPLSANRVTCID
jgi:hypothetical protein